MVDQLITAAVVAALNHMLGREPWARARLAPFAGRVARFESSPFSLQVAVRDDGTFAAAGGPDSTLGAKTEPTVTPSAGDPAVTVSLPLSSLPFAALSPQAPIKDIQLRGDAEFAQALAEVLQNVRPEPEDELSRWVGDIAAQRIVGALRASSATLRQLATNLADNAANYVVAENPMVVSREEITTFNSDVNRLRDDVARLEKRIERLQTR